MKKNTADEITNSLEQLRLLEKIFFVLFDVFDTFVAVPCKIPRKKVFSATENQIPEKTFDKNTSEDEPKTVSHEPLGRLSKT